MRNLIFILLFVFSTSLLSQNIKRSNSVIVDENNNEVILKGIGLGGWMLQEPYMFNYIDAADAQYDFKNKLVEFIGQENTDAFFQAWLENFVTQEDINLLASWGFNSVRLPMHYELFTYSIQDEPVAGENTWLETGFDIVDQLLDWCEQNQMYLILDLHAAPGGQGYNSDISDYNPNYPSLWESVENQNKTIALWGEIANRYNDEPWIGGYDLLNETNWNLGTNELRSFYIQVTDAIREHDQDHIIFIEGNWFANDFSGLTPPWDDNMVYSFHKYWSYNSPTSLDWVLSIKNQYNYPLWMGESGENSNAWFTDAISLFEDNDIGWAFWPWKKIESISSPFSISSNTNYEWLIDYFRGDASPPSVNIAVDGLMQLAQDVLVSNTTYQKDVIDAMIRQPGDNTSIPFSDHTIPGTIYASDYDLGNDGVAYSDEYSATYHIDTDNFQAWNQGWTYRNDGVDIESNNDSDSNGYHISFIQDGEWMLYTVDVQQSGFYNIVTRYSSQESGGLVNLTINEVPIAQNIELYNTGGFNSYINKLTTNVYLESGVHKLKVKIVGNGYFHLTSITFDESTEENPAFDLITGMTMEDEQSILLVLNHPIVSDQELNLDSFEVKLNGEISAIENILIDQSNPQGIIIQMEEYLSFQETITVSMSDDNYILSIFDDYLPSFDNYPVENNLTERIVIPGFLQSEDFVYQEGLQTEVTTDAGGGYNVGYTDQGDFADYMIAVNNTGNYNIRFRTASESQSGMLQLQLINDESTESLVVVSTPITGGWQQWETFTVVGNIEEGLYKLRMKVLQPGFNINWIEFDYIEGSMGIYDNNKDDFSIYPNPVTNYLNISTLNPDFKIQIYNLLGSRLLEHNNIRQINVEALNKGVYLIRITNENIVHSEFFIKK
ncbi:MAG: carbohydrate-binding protein [Bacteroidota bacterium]|nr:carbohydrate-binding protein [Bacteroidota bacterium]